MSIFDAAYPGKSVPSLSYDYGDLSRDAERARSPATTRLARRRRGVQRLVMRQRESTDIM
jgi:hypothetical protein